MQVSKEGRDRNSQLVQRTFYIQHSIFSDMDEFDGEEQAGRLLKAKRSPTKASTGGGVETFDFLTGDFDSGRPPPVVIDNGQWVP